CDGRLTRRSGKRPRRGVDRLLWGFWRALARSRGAKSVAGMRRPGDGIWRPGAGLGRPVAGVGRGGAGVRRPGAGSARGGGRTAGRGALAGGARAVSMARGVTPSGRKGRFALDGGGGRFDGRVRGQVAGAVAALHGFVGDLHQAVGAFLVGGVGGGGGGADG